MIIVTLEFFKQKHGHEIEGVWMPRVTAITSLVSRPFFNGSYLAADWGTLVHSSIEKILKGEQVSLKEKIAPSLQAFAKWQRSQGIVIQNPARDIEARVYDFEHGYAGTIDLIAGIQGRLGVVDIKTGNGIRDEYYLQTAAYLNAHNKNADRKNQARTRWILRIDQYEECRGCLARRKEKNGKERISGGKAWCNHQWASPKGEVEFLELDNFEQDFEAFLSAKEVWEWYYRGILAKIRNYPRNIIQKILV